MFIERGEEGKNKYGEDPKAEEAKRSGIENVAPVAVAQNGVQEIPKEKTLENKVPQQSQSVVVQKAVSEASKESAPEKEVPRKESKILNEYVVHLKQAAAEGDVEASMQLANCYYEGTGVVQSYGEALKIWQSLAEKGNSNAMYNVALCYYQGKGIAQNLRMAKFYLSKACSLKNDTACRLLEKIDN